MSSTANLPEYVALAKNVRGIFTFDLSNEPPSELKTWLARIHRYRNVGIPPSIDDGTQLDLSAKTFERLPYPLEKLGEFVDHLSEHAPRWVVESLVLSSAYVAPLFVHRSALVAFEPAAVWQLRMTGDLPGEQIKRHMRIAGYGMLDFHREVTAAATKAVKNDGLQKEQKRREKICKEDGHERFWRLLDEDDPEPSLGEWVGGYCDILGLLDATAMEQLRAAPELSVALGVAGVFVVEQPSG